MVAKLRGSCVVLPLQSVIIHQQTSSKRILQLKKLYSKRTGHIRWEGGGGKKELKYFSFIVTIRIKERLITGVRGRREIRTPTKKISIFLFEIGYIVIKFELFPRGTIIFQENNQLNGKHLVGPT